MAATTNAPMTKTLKIDLHRAGSPSERRGTFVGPPPKMRLRPGAVISFDLKVTPNDPDATFEVTFPATPFTDDDTPTGKPVFSITNSNPHVGIFQGLYHYKVSVTTKDSSGRVEVFEISHCPELDLDPNV
jgi:hypothetical protein